MAQRGFTIWFTGLSGAGKSTLAEALEPVLKARGHNVEILDGDIVRTNLSKGLGFSKEDRDTNILRIGFVAHLLSRNGVAVITAAISPYRDIRDQNRALIGDFVEVYVECSIPELTRRDVKGLYEKALQGRDPELHRHLRPLRGAREARSRRQLRARDRRGVDEQDPRLPRVGRLHLEGSRQGLVARLCASSKRRGPVTGTGLVSAHTRKEHNND